MLAASRRWRASSRPTTCPRPAVSAGRTCSTTTIAATPAISGSAPTPSSRHASRPATSSSSSAAGSARPPARRSRCLTCPGRARPSSTSTTTRRSWAASTRPTSPIPSGLNAFATRGSGTPAGGGTAVGRGYRRGPCRGAGVAGADAHRRPAPARRDRGWLGSRAPGRHHRHQRRRQLRDLGQPPLRLSRPRRPSSPRPRARWATACRPRSRPSSATRTERSSASPATAAS